MAFGRRTTVEPVHLSFSTGGSSSGGLSRCATCTSAASRRTFSIPSTPRCTSAGALCPRSDDVWRALIADRHEKLRAVSHCCGLQGIVRVSLPPPGCWRTTTEVGCPAGGFGRTVTRGSMEARQRRRRWPRCPAPHDVRALRGVPADPLGRVAAENRTATVLSLNDSVDLGRGAARLEDDNGRFR